MSDRRYRCPECHKSDGLWEGLMVSGWRSLTETLAPEGEREADWNYVEADGAIGCSCGWQGGKSSLEALGIDGEPLPPVIPGQLAIGAEEPA